jgi:hypothetical protein
MGEKMTHPEILKLQASEGEDQFCELIDALTDEEIIGLTRAAEADAFTPNQWELLAVTLADRLDDKLWHEEPK